ncbi:unnamed protein product [Effrenium voratum]|uniref:Uncharacterized protein n=1 Tax=Effrenium voratum TaxID=2562239 RepID=A0AA36N7F0_9DINO|nr:unnamed protein product [Effrenium voratum]
MGRLLLQGILRGGAGGRGGPSEPAKRGPGPGAAVAPRQGDDAATARLCREVLADGFVASELATRWLPWAADTCRHEGASLAQAVAVSSAPALVLIRAVPQGSPGAMEYPSGCFFRVLSILTGTIGAQQLLYLLKAEAERADLEQSLRLQWQQQLGHMERVSQNVAQALETRQEARRCEEEERLCLDTLYESRFEAPAPCFFKGTFGEAMEAARDQQRLLLVWLFGSEPSAMCAALGGEVFGAFVSEYFVLWPGDAEKWFLPMQLRDMLRLQLPSFLVLEPLSVFEAEVFPWADPRSGAAVEFPGNCAWSFLGALEGTSITEETGSCPSWRSRATPTGPSAGTWRRSGRCSACALLRRSASGPRTASTSPTQRRRGRSRGSRPPRRPRKPRSAGKRRKRWSRRRRRARSANWCFAFLVAVDLRGPSRRTPRCRRSTTGRTVLGSWQRRGMPSKCQRRSSCWRPASPESSC